MTTKMKFLAKRIQPSPVATVCKVYEVYTRDNETYTYVDDNGKEALTIINNWRMLNELEVNVEVFNQLADSSMTLCQISTGYYRLMIDGEDITEGDYEDILQRVKGINREHGYDWDVAEYLIMED